MRRRILASAGGKPYLRRVAYLESHGTEYIDTLVKPNNETGMAVDLALTHNSDSYGDVFLLGCRNNSGNTRFVFATEPINLYAGFGVAMSGTKIKTAALKRFYESLNYKNDRKYLCDLGIDRYVTSTLPDFDYSCKIFGRDAYGTINTYPYRIYGFQMTQGSDVILDFFPVIDLSGRPAMYDEVSGNLFYNQGTGEFSWGELETV